tara:strand:+ start:243 stop:470 length:228 start_codon:yes stop_codon:yes gene_type:complete
MKIVTLDEDNNIVVRTKKYEQAIYNCLRWFKLHDINAFECNESVYIEAYNFDLQISTAEVFYRAELYKSISEEVI